ncbi:MAG: CPBP family intramembrane metalloprotease [Limnochordia bacterium]|jgi:membrane protease YdiL (CAAX protease family)|nr:CPBP family intramembrane metalloprotease [Limnochordia bacterium]MDD2629437.1 CPBP family intramembrane metalloprotease [Limnochordia bacterium]MDD4518013.1 CPBP family intramembrane metalloprotease [Limnochordia bacterium]
MESRTTSSLVGVTMAAFVFISAVLMLPLETFCFTVSPRLLAVIFLSPFYVMILGCFVSTFRDRMTVVFSNKRNLIFYFLFLAGWGSLLLLVREQFRFYYLPYILIVHALPVMLSRNWGKRLSWKDILLALYLAVIAQSSFLGGDGGLMISGQYPFIFSASFSHLSAFTTTLLIYLVIRKVDLGYTLDLSRKEFLLSIGLILVLLVLLVPLGLAWGFLTPGVETLRWQNFWVAAAFFLFNSSLGEELLARGILQNYVFSVLPKGSSWTGILIASLVFGLGHIYNPKFAVLAFLASLAFGWIYWRTGKLWSAVLVHGGINVIWQLVYLWC